jgi:hypothetical protein
VHFCLMSIRSIGLAGIISISLMVLGCAVSDSTSDYQWQLAKQRQQVVGRAFGRIGYIGNAGATALGSTSSNHP